MGLRELWNDIGEFEIDFKIVIYSEKFYYKLI
jgi:hypothetical protein